jgi:uncharacterized YccA/Bax inhibitor family protein
MRTSNPALTDSTFTRYGEISANGTMTMHGVVIKTFLLLMVVLLSAGWTWTRFFKSGGNVEVIYPWVMGGAFVGFIFAMATTFKQTWAPVTAPLYALCQGFFVGGLSAIMEVSFPGIAIQATLLTFGTMIAMLLAYQSGLIRATEKFKLGIVAATGGIALLYLVTIGLSFFNIQVPFIYGGGAIGIGFSLFVVIIAALNFILDFDFIEQAARRGSPKYMEWYASFALMVTLIWLYIEFLRLLSKLREK